MTTVLLYLMGRLLDTLGMLLVEVVLLGLMGRQLVQFGILIETAQVAPGNAVMPMSAIPHDPSPPSVCIPAHPPALPLSQLRILIHRAPHRPATESGMHNG